MHPGNGTGAARPDPRQSTPRHVVGLAAFSGSLRGWLGAGSDKMALLVSPTSTHQCAARLLFPHQGATPGCWRDGNPKGRFADASPWAALRQE